MKKLLILWALLVCPQLALAQGPEKLCYTTNGTNCVPAVASSNSKAISTASATTVELLPLVANKNIYVTSFNIVSAGTTTYKFVYGTGTACGTGTTDLTGAYTLIANGYVSSGNGLGIVLLVPPGNALCATNSQAIQISGSFAYAQY